MTTKKRTTSAALAALLASSLAAQAQTERSTRLEEIVVTAQRKAQRLQDVPISISAFDGHFLQEQGVTDLQDVAQYVPNVRIDQAGTNIQPRVRGIATNTIVNRGLSLPVGIVIDEVPYSRSDYFVTGLFDIERVEVLRGPQGQLFGANTTVGLLNITTANPTEDFSGSFSAEAGDLSHRRFEAALGGPLIPGQVNFRVAALRERQGDYIDNTTLATQPGAPEGFGRRDRQSLRAKLDIPDLLGVSLLLSYQRDELDFGDEPTELTYVPERWRDFILSYDPNTDFEAGNFVGSHDYPGYRKTDIDTFSATLSYDLGEWAVNMVVGTSELTSDSLSDTDNTPVAAQTARVEEDSLQHTAELRLSSPDLDGLFGLESLFGLPLGYTEFTAGVFYQTREQQPTTARIDINTPVTLSFNVIAGLDFLPAPPGPLPEKWEYFIAEFRQDATEKAAFGQFTWSFLDDWTVLAGVRISELEKEATWLQVVGSDDGVCCLLGEFLGQFNGTAEDVEKHTAPKIGLKFDWSDEINFYLTWAEGFQPGGFNNFSNSASLEARTVDPAFVDSWEAGTKMRLLNGSAELNIGLFWTTMTDFQQFTLADDADSVLSIAQVVNVGELRVRGVEMDFNWLPTHWLNLRGALGYNDTEYLEFPIGTCFGDRTNTDGDDDDRCDLSGQPLTQAPKWEASLTPAVNLPLSSIAIVPSFLQAIELTGSLGIQYTHERFLHESNDPRTEQPAYLVVNAGIGLRHPSQGWTLQVRVQNLTDKDYNKVAYEAAPFNGTTYKTPAYPRTVTSTIRWQF